MIRIKKRKPKPPLPEGLKALVFVPLFRNKILLGCTAQGADPIRRKILKIRVLINSVVHVTVFGIILITAQLAHINQHTLKILLLAIVSCNRFKNVLYDTAFLFFCQYLFFIF